MKRLIIGVTFVFSITGCLGGGLGDYEPTPAQKEAAEQFKIKFADFLTDANATGRYTLTKLKSATDHGYWWVVVYDQLTDSSIAVDLQNYDPNGDINSFLNDKSHFFYNLQAIPGHYEYDSVWDSVCSCYKIEENWVGVKYMHVPTGILFEKTTSSPKDLETMAAFREDFEVKQTAEKVQQSLGLSVERSQEVAYLIRAWSKNGGREMTSSERDRFSEELLGFKISEAERTLKNADTATAVKQTVDELVSRAAETNSTTPEQIRQIVGSMMNE